MSLLPQSISLDSVYGCIVLASRAAALESSHVQEEERRQFYGVSPSAPRKMGEKRQMRVVSERFGPRNGHFASNPHLSVETHC